MKKTDKALKLSEIIITPIQPTAKGIIAFVSFILNDTFKVNNIMIATSLKRNGNLRLVYPVKTLPNGKDVQIFYPITKEAGKELENQTLTAYNIFLSKLKREE